MKRYKELRKTISENGTFYVGAGTRVSPLAGDANALDLDMNLSSLSPEAISRINVYLGAMSAKPYINPMEALKQARGRLQMIGLDFEMNRDCEVGLREGREQSFPIVRFGGVFGSDGTQYGTFHDDGITPKLGHGLSLYVCTHPLPNGTTQVEAQIVPTN